ncbi:MAG: glucuronate isomerase [Lentisphaerae bacterium]|nr:MAG: glucuronate isomerase [Lentisphaerota bacterium]
MTTSLFGENYLITSQSGLEIYREIEHLPIIDPHNHADVKEIAENKNYTDLWQIEGATDHYVWELLRKRGIPESHITGNASNEEKWLAAASVWEELIGNPTYEWVSLDLRRILGIEDPINAQTARSIWEKSKIALAQPGMKPQNLLRQMNVEVMCSTDDPTFTLEHHQALQNSPIANMVRPTFRPDRAMHIFKPDWKEYITDFENFMNTRFNHIRDLIQALQARHDYFAENGCLASDHGVEVPYAYQVEEEDANAAFRKAYEGKALSQQETIAYMSYVLNEVAEMDAQKGWVFQLHLGVKRDVRASLYETIGVDSGGDISRNDLPIVDPLIPLLNRFDDRLKIVLYCIDPTHQPTLATLTRAFGPKVNLGSAWWFNDTPVGMKNQLEYIATVDLLSNFAGMVSDSRKLFSYASRHEMFRRCLADVLGKLVDQGRAPLSAAIRLAQRIAYRQVKEFWGF